MIVWPKLKKYANSPPTVQNSSASLTLNRELASLATRDSRLAHCASSSQALKRRRPAPGLRPPHLRAPFLLSGCTSSAGAGLFCLAPCPPSRPRLGVPRSRRTGGARDSAQNCCGQGAGQFAVFVSLILFSDELHHYRMRSYCGFS